MRILLVNDDGIGSEGIWALAEAARAAGHEATICAPAEQQSAKSHGITLFTPIFLKDKSRDGIPAYAVGGTPADCVRIGILMLMAHKPDLLISGINDGYNAGMATWYSGTVGAAREGTLNQVPSMAVSLAAHADDAMRRNLARVAVRMGERLARADIPPVTVLNVNAPAIPPEKLQPPVFAPLSVSYYMDSYERRVSPRAGDYFWMDSGEALTEPTPGSDLDFLHKGHITCTFMGLPAQMTGDLSEFLQE